VVASLVEVLLLRVTFSTPKVHVIQRFQDLRARTLDGADVTEGYLVSKLNYIQ